MLSEIFNQNTQNRPLCQGDVTAIVDGSGNTVADYAYDAWGKVLSVTGTMASALGQLNPLRYRGYVYDYETQLYYLQSRYYDPVIGRFINADGVIAGVGSLIQGYNMFAYCFNNPTMLSDSTGNWPDLKKALRDAWNGFKGLLKSTFGAGVVQARRYKAIEMDTIFGGEEYGQETSFVVAGSTDKPVSVYVQNASDWWKVTEYKVGIQVNTDNGGASYSWGLGEVSLTVADKNRSFEAVSGINKIGYTISDGVDFGNLTSEAYYHGYIRTIPTAAAVAVVAITAYYSGGAAIIPAFALAT